MCGELDSPTLPNSYVIHCKTIVPVMIMLFFLYSSDIIFPVALPVKYQKWYWWWVSPYLKNI